jgi:glycosyltransferase involved in cell wall biosynthesis
MRYSLLVPCYNAEKYVDSFLENISKLSVRFDEIIFYDDASTDNTARLLKSKGYNLIEGKSNKGPGYARNRLAEVAKGDYIHFHDIDDEISPQFLELVNKTNDLSDTEVILGNADWIDSKTRESLIKWKYNLDEINVDPVGYFISNPLGIINTVYKRDAFLEIQGFNEKLKCWEDSDLHVRLALAGANFSVIDEVLAFSIRHNEGISKKQDWCWGCRMNYLEKYKQDLQKTHSYVLGKEFEKTADALFFYNKFANAIKAFHNSRKCNDNAPEVNNKVLKYLKKISPLFAFLLRGLIIKFKS